MSTPSACAATGKLSALGLDAAMLADYEAFLGTLAAPPAVPERVLTVCRARVAAIHGLTADEPALDAATLEALRRGSFGSFDAAERAALALVDSMAMQPHAMTDAEVEHAVSHFGAAGAVALLTAIAFADAELRLQQTLPAPRSAGTE